MSRIINLFNNPIVLCGSIAFGIVLVLVIVVVICCKKGMANEREELKALSDEIDADLNDEVISCEEQKIENVLSKMQEALETKEQNPITFEQEQEENAVISYQELLNSLGAKNSIDVDSLELYDDDADNRFEISDFNKEIIDAYQKENLDREIYNFQNDYSSEALSSEVLDETPVMNFDFSAENVEFVQEQDSEVYDASSVVSNMPKKFKKTEVISPVYGIIDEKNVVPKPEEVEEIVFDDFDDSLLDEF